MNALPELETTTALPRIEPLARARRHVPGGPPVGGPVGAVLVDVRHAAVAVREEVRASGTPDAVATRPLVTQPHPTAWALHRATRSPLPLVWLTDHMLVVQWTRHDGGREVLLWGAADHEHDAATVAMRLLRDRLPLPAGLVRTVHGRVTGHLRSLGVDPADVTLLAFDHLHTQDLRRELGTVGPDPVLSPDGPLRAWFPNARMLVQRAEWETLRHPHPLQQRWYQPDTFAGLPPDRLVQLDGDHLLGPGVALVATPGHTAGNQSLVLHLAGRVHVVSGNGVAAECWAPSASRLPGVRRHALDTGNEVVPRASTLEFASWQYASMVAEALLADRSPDGRFPLLVPTGELTAHRLAPGMRPTWSAGPVEHGHLLPSSALGPGGAAA